jgi:hypothetical protein
MNLNDPTVSRLLAQAVQWMPMDKREAAFQVVRRLQTLEQVKEFCEALAEEKRDIGGNQ